MVHIQTALKYKIYYIETKGVGMMKRKFFFYFFLITSILFSIQPVFAGSNALTRFEYDEAAGTGFFDLVVSLDWEPTSEEIDGTLQTAFQQFACDIFTMTEGHHKVRNIHVYTDGQQMNTADIRISNEVGRSSAYVNGIFQKGARILAYTLYEDQSPRAGEFLGHTLAHEFAHYYLGHYAEGNLLRGAGSQVQTYGSVNMSELLQGEAFV